MITTLFIDFDGTIADSTSGLLSLINQLAAKYRFAQVQQTDISEYRELSLKDKFRKLGIRWYQIPFVVRDAQRLQRERIDSLSLIDGWEEILPQLSEKYHLHIVSSNKAETIEKFLQEKNIRHYFGQVWGESSLFGKKRVIKKALKKLQLDPTQVLYIGDEERDIDASHKAGLHIVSVSWGFCTAELLKKYQPDYLVESLAELLPILSAVA